MNRRIKKKFEKRKGCKTYEEYKFHMRLAKSLDDWTITLLKGLRDPAIDFIKYYYPVRLPSSALPLNRLTYTTRPINLANVTASVPPCPKNPNIRGTSFIKVGRTHRNQSHTSELYDSLH